MRWRDWWRCCRKERSRRNFGWRPDPRWRRSAGGWRARPCGPTSRKCVAHHRTASDDSARRVGYPAGRFQELSGMKITIVGAGYVGLVTGVCLADFGHDVICVDKDHRRIEAMVGGDMPIYEPGLVELVAANT